MFSVLKKIFGGEAPPPHASQSARHDAPPPDSEDTPFLRREAIFDRSNRLAGHLFHLPQSTPLAADDKARQRLLDENLLATLNASPESWNANLAFIPLSSSSLDLPGLDRLKAANVVLLLQLADDAEADIVCAAIEGLRERGFLTGVFRQPKHPAFARVIRLVDYAAIDISANDAMTARDFSAAIRTGVRGHPVRVLACNIDTADEHRFCQQWYFDHFHGKFATSPPAASSPTAGDPDRAQLMNLLRLVQGDAETAEIAAAMKLDPLLSFRVLRYLNSPALGLSHRIDSLEQALIILGRQRLTRWLAVLLFSVRNSQIGDWLTVENALTRGRLMEVLGEQTMPGQSRDPLFLTGIFSCLDALLRRPLTDILDDMLLAEDIRLALLQHDGPYAPLLAVAKAGEAFDQAGMKKTALAAGIDPASLNRALLAATAWAAEVAEYWE